MSNQALTGDIFPSQWTLRLPVVSPFLTQGYTGKFGVDTVAARNHQDKIFIPGSLIKGVFRSVLEDYGNIPSGEDLGDMKILQEAAQKIHEWFGKGSVENDVDSNMPGRGRINFADLVATNKEDSKNILHRISIDDFTGAVKQGNFQVIELPFPVGETVIFEGKIRFLGTLDEAKFFEMVLGKALSLVPAIGSFKSVGFGRINQDQGMELIVEAKSEPQDKEVSLSAFGNDGHISVRMSFDRPIVMSADRVTNNLFRGRTHFPGSVLKGALAETIAQNNDTDKFSALLSAVRFSHACPVKKEKEVGPYDDMPLPLSLYVTQKDNKVFGDYLLDPERSNHMASEELLFQNDWKECISVKASERLGQHEGPGLAMRTRTRIDPQTQTAYEEDEGGELFSYQAVLTNEHDWVCHLYLDPEEDFPDALKADFLEYLSSDIFQMGKSKAYCQISLFEQSTVNSHYAAGDDVIITLTSGGALLDIDEARQDRHIRQCYEDYFAGLGLELIDYMVSQKMTGGYLGMRYGKADYKPWLLTERGSVFHLKVKEEADLAALANQGLPVAQNLSADWQENPFIPQNGYGAFVIDMNANLLEKLNRTQNLEGGKNVS